MEALEGVIEQIGAESIGVTEMWSICDRAI